MQDKPSLYLETSMISYLVGWLSRDLITAAHQQITREWWEKEREKFHLYISPYVMEEISKGDINCSQERLDLIKNISLLRPKVEIEEIANQYIQFLQLPPKATFDAFHLAIASYYAMDILLTWNLTHIANRIFVRKYEEKNQALNLSSPIVCTPEDLLNLGD